MHRKLTTALVAIAAVLALVVALPATMQAQDDEVHKEKRIVIKKMGDGDELHEIHEGGGHVIFIGDDGEKHELHGMAEGMSWAMAGHGEQMKFAFAGMGSGAFLGVGTTELTPELRSHFGAPDDLGVMVSKVIDDSGAFTAGLLVGDIITGVDGEEISSGHALRKAIGSREEGDSVLVELWRDGKAQNLSAVLGKSEGFKELHGGDHFARAMKIDCEDGSADCNIWMSHDIEACEGDEECEVTVSCDDGDCTCQVDGVETDCDELKGVHIDRD